MAYRTGHNSPPKIRIKSFKLTLSLIIALAAVGCKLIFPNVAATAAEKLRAAVDANWDYTAAFAQIKESVTSGKEMKNLAHDIYTAIFFPGAQTEVAYEEEEKAGISPSAQPNVEGVEDHREGTAAQALPVLSFRSYSVAQYVKAHNIGQFDLSAVLQAKVEQEQQSTAQNVLLAFEEEQAQFDHLKMPDNALAGYIGLEFSYADPLDGQITSPYGYRVHPITQEVTFHYGVDIGAREGQAVHAFAEGTVVCTGSNDIYGNYILLKHSGGTETFYAHLDAIRVRSNAQVALGQKIGTAGATGLSTGPHLHFGIRCSGNYVNPMFYIGGKSL